MSNRFGILASQPRTEKIGVTRSVAMNQTSSVYETNGESANEAHTLFDNEGSTRSSIQGAATSKNGLTASLLTAQVVAAGSAHLNMSPDNRGTARIDVRVTPQLMTILSAILSRKLTADRPRSYGVSISSDTGVNVR